MNYIKNILSGGAITRKYRNDTRSAVRTLHDIKCVDRQRVKWLRYVVRLDPTLRACNMEMETNRRRRRQRKTWIERVSDLLRLHTPAYHATQRPTHSCLFNIIFSIVSPPHIKARTQQGTSSIGQNQS